MPTFTERAVLEVVDQSTPTIKKINAELDKLLRKAGKLNGSSAKAVSRAMADLGTGARRTRREVEAIGKTDALGKVEAGAKRAGREVKGLGEEARRTGRAINRLTIAPSTVRTARQLRDEVRATARAAEDAARSRARFLEQVGRGSRTQSAEQTQARQVATDIARAIRDGSIGAARQITDASRDVASNGQTAARAIADAGRTVGTQTQGAAATISQAAQSLSIQGRVAAGAIAQAGEAAARQITQSVDAARSAAGADDYRPALPSVPATGDTRQVPPPPHWQQPIAAGTPGSTTAKIAADATRAIVDATERNQRALANTMSDASQVTARMIAEATARVQQAIAHQSPQDQLSAAKGVLAAEAKRVRDETLKRSEVNVAKRRQGVFNAIDDARGAKSALDEAREAQRQAYLRDAAQTDDDSKRKRRTARALQDATRAVEAAEDRDAKLRAAVGAAREKFTKARSALRNRSTINAAADANEVARKLADDAAKRARTLSPPSPTATPLHPVGPQAAAGGGAGGGGAGGGSVPPVGGAGGSGGAGGNVPPTPPTYLQRARGMVGSVYQAGQHMAPYMIAGGVLGAGRNTLATGAEGIVYAQNQRELTSIQNLRPEALSSIATATEKLGSEFRQLSRAQVLEMTRDAINASGTPEDGAKIAREMAKNAANLSLLYGSSEKGMEAARQFYRAADISGDSDNADSATVFMRALTKETIRSGKDINARSVAQAVANLGTAKFGMNEDSIAGLVALSDNVRGQTSAYIRQFHEYLTSNSIKDENRDAQERAGLRDKQRGGVVDAALFQADKFEWVMKYIKPLVERKIGRSLDDIKDDGEKAALIDKALADSGLKPSSIKLPSEFLMNEARERRRRVLYGRVNLDGANTLADRNIQQAGEAIKRKFQDVADFWTSKMQGPVAGAGGAIATALDWLGSNPEKKSGPSFGPEPEKRAGMDATKLAAATAVITAGAVAKYAMDHPGQIALGGAAVALGGSATALTAAAAALSGAAVAQKAGGLAGIAGGAAAAGGAAGAAAKVGKALLKGGGAVAAAVVAHDAYQWARENSGQMDPVRSHGGTEAAREEHARRVSASLAAERAETVKETVRQIEQMTDRPMLGGAFDDQGRWRGPGGMGKTIAQHIEGLPRVADPYGGLHLEQLRKELSTPPTSVPSIGVDGADIGATITNTVQAVAPTLSGAVAEGGNQAAPTLTQALVNGASQAGETIAAAMRAAVQNLTVSVTGGGNSNTGTNPQAAR